MTIKRLITALLSNLLIIMIVTAIFGIVGGYVNYNVIHEKYTAYSTFYVLEKKSENVDENDSTSYSDLRTSQMLVDDYNVLATSRKVKEKVASNIGVKTLAPYKITISSNENTRVMKLTVTGEEKELTAKIANEMVEVFKETVIEIMNVENVNVVDYAQVPTKPSSPAKLKNTILSIAAGFVVSCGVVLMIELLANTIKSAEEIEELFELPVLAQVGGLKGTSNDEFEASEKVDDGEKLKEEKTKKKKKRGNSAGKKKTK